MAGLEWPKQALRIFDFGWIPILSTKIQVLFVFVEYWFTFSAFNFCLKKIVIEMLFNVCVV
jgi:hypothetical protein